MRFQCPKCGNIVLIGNNAFGTAVQCGSCFSVLTVPPSRVSLGAVVGDFIIRKELGRGGMGVVYLAHQISLDRPAALKILADAYANNAEFVVGFIKEARAAAKLNHPHIVQAYAVGEDEGLFYFAMENIDGETMKSVLKREKIIPVEDAINIIQQIAEALHYAWIEQKLIHRDIKPDNIMLTSSGRAKLADLGLARVAGDIDDSDSDEVMGTPQYISPEHLTGAPMDGRSDIYSLGATFYHFVTGQFPFDGATATEIAQKHLTAPLIPPSRVNPKVPQCVSRIIEKMMAKNPVMRYQDAEALVEDLRIAKKLIETTSTPILLQKGKTAVDRTAAVTPTDITGSRIFSDDTITRALDTRSLQQGRHVKNKDKKKSNTDLILLGLVILLIAIVAGAIIAVNFASNNRPNAKKNKTEHTKKDKTNALAVADKKKEMKEILDFIENNKNKFSAVRDRCEIFLHDTTPPKNEDEQELYAMIVGYFHLAEEKMMHKARIDAASGHEKELKRRAEAIKKKIEDDRHRKDVADRLKKENEEMLKAEEIRKQKQMTMETEVAAAENAAMTELLSCSIYGDFVGAADAVARLQKDKFELLLITHSDFRSKIYERIKAAKYLGELMDCCADFQDELQNTGELLKKTKIQIDGQSVVITKIKDGYLYYEVGEKKIGQRKSFAELIKNYESAYEDIVIATAAKKNVNDLLVAFFAFSGNCNAAGRQKKELPPEKQGEVGKQIKMLGRIIKCTYNNTKNEKVKQKLRNCYEEDFPEAFK